VSYLVRRVLRTSVKQITESTGDKKRASIGEEDRTEAKRKRIAKAVHSPCGLAI
jgi:hypothetical protein